MAIPRTIPVIDLHCDLLFYLEEKSMRSAYDLASRCAIPQLKKGNVKLQTMAIFTRTDSHSVQKGMNQLQIYQQLNSKYPDDFKQYSHSSSLKSPQIAILMAFENASGFCGENESLEEGINRLNHVIDNIAKPLYISLTWNSENRFGGGAQTQIGLKEDGKRLLEVIEGRGIAIDLSHASDTLAFEVIEYIEIKKLTIPLIASHSNARVVASQPRNLPDEIAKEIFRRGGVVGLNLYRHFLGESEESLPKHLEHWLKLGGENHIVCGTDFFYEADLNATSLLGKESFFKDFQDASCYVRLLDFIKTALNLSDSILNKFAFQNALNFIQNISNIHIKNSL